MLDRLSDSSVRTVLGLGSGSSAIWFATTLAKRGGEGPSRGVGVQCRVRRGTRTELTKQGLQDRAQVLHAPLVGTAVPGRENQPWFDISVLPDLPPVDLLFVDGPVGATARGALPAHIRCWPTVSREARRLSSTIPADRPRRPSSKRGNRSPSAAGGFGRCGASIVRPRSSRGPLADGSSHRPRRSVAGTGGARCAFRVAMTGLRDCCTRGYREGGAGGSAASALASSTFRSIASLLVATGKGGRPAR